MTELSNRASAIKLSKAVIARRAGLCRNTVVKVLAGRGNYTVASQDQIARVIAEEEARLADHLTGVP